VNTKERAKLANAVEVAMRAIQAADDELDDPQGNNMELIRVMVTKCRDRCTEILSLLPSQDVT
jgi:hypothetical protein